VRLVASEAFDGEYAVRRQVAYEVFYIDEQRDLVPRGEPVRPDVLTFQSWAVGGQWPLRRCRRPGTARRRAVQVSQEGFAVVRASDLRPVAAEAQAVSEAGAQRLLAELIRDNPALEGEALVVPAFEVNQS
jgi:hypothetical protein